MTRVFGSPHRYIQGPGAFDRLADIGRGLGGTVALVIDRDVLSFLRDRIAGLFAPPPLILPFAGEITLPAIEALTRDARKGGASGIICIGGGKALDAGKGVARRLDCDYVTVPTIASNDSPAGRSVAVYDDHHTMVLIEQLERHPIAVIVDTAIIAQAPPRFLRSGIGDAVAKKFEAEASVRDGSVNFFGTRPLRTAMIVADGCYRTLRAHGKAAMEAAIRHEVTDDFEAVVEAAVLMSGFAWESGGLSLAHAVVRGLVRARGASSAAHGEHVAYGLLVQLAAEGRSDAFLDDLTDFYGDVELPVRLADLGMSNPTHPEIVDIARLTASGPKGGKIIVSADQETLVHAIQRTEQRAGRRLTREKGAAE